MRETVPPEMTHFDLYNRFVEKVDQLGVSVSLQISGLSERTATQHAALETGQDLLKEMVGSLDGKVDDLGTRLAFLEGERSAEKARPPRVVHAASGWKAPSTIVAAISAFTLVISWLYSSGWGLISNLISAIAQYFNHSTGPQ